MFLKIIYIGTEINNFINDISLSEQEITLWRKGEKTRKNLQTCTATSPQLPHLMSGAENLIPAHNHNSEPKNLSGTIEDMKRDLNEEDNSTTSTMQTSSSHGDACSTNVTSDNMDE